MLSSKQLMGLALPESAVLEILETSFPMPDNTSQKHCEHTE